LNIAIEGSILTRPMCGTVRYIKELIKYIVNVNSAEDNVYVISSVVSDPDLKKVKVVNKLSRDLNIDLYHRTYPMQSYSEAISSRKFSRKMVFTPHDLIQCSHPEYHGNAGYAVSYKQLMGDTLSVSDRVIAISNHGKSDIVDRFSIAEDKIEVIYHGIDPDKFKRVVTKNVDLPEKYILFVGADYPHKNLSSLLKAFRLVSNTEVFKGYKLVCVGNREHLYSNSSFKDDLERLGDKVIMNVSVPDEWIPEIYSRAAVLVMPSVYEGFGFPILEAMACGTPVICSELSSLPEVAGNAAVIVDATDPGCLASAITKVVSNTDLSGKLSGLGLQRAKLFTWEECARKTYDLYKRTSKGKHENTVTAVSKRRAVL